MHQCPHCHATLTIKLESKNTTILVQNKLKITPLIYDQVKTFFEQKTKDQTLLHIIASEWYEEFNQQYPNINFGVSHFMKILKQLGVSNSIVTKIRGSTNKTIRYSTWAKEMPTNMYQ